MAVLKCITFLIFMFIKNVDDLFCLFLKWLGRITINFFCIWLSCYLQLKKKKVSCSLLLLGCLFYCIRKQWRSENETVAEDLACLFHFLQCPDFPFLWSSAFLPNSSTLSSLFLKKTAVNEWVFHCVSVCRRKTWMELTNNCPLISSGLFIWC